MGAKQDPQDRMVRELLRNFLVLDDVLKAPSTRKLAEERNIHRSEISREIRDFESIVEKKLFDRIDGKGLRLRKEEKEFLKKYFQSVFGNSRVFGLCPSKEIDSTP